MHLGKKVQNHKKKMCIDRQPTGLHLPRLARVTPCSIPRHRGEKRAPTDQTQNTLNMGKLEPRRSSKAILMTPANHSKHTPATHPARIKYQRRRISSSSAPRAIAPIKGPSKACCDGPIFSQGSIRAGIFQQPPVNSNSASADNASPRSSTSAH